MLELKDWQIYIGIYMVKRKLKISPANLSLHSNEFFNNFHHIFCWKHKQMTLHQYSPNSPNLSIFLTKTLKCNLYAFYYMLFICHSGDTRCSACWKLSFLKISHFQQKWPKFLPNWAFFIFFVFLYHLWNGLHCSSDFQHHCCIIGETVTNKAQN